MAVSVSSSDEACAIPQFDARPEVVLGSHGRVDFVVSDSSEDTRRRQLPSSSPVVFDGVSPAPRRTGSPGAIDVAVCEHVGSREQTPKNTELGRDWMPPAATMASEDDRTHFPANTGTGNSSDSSSEEVVVEHRRQRRRRRSDKRTHAPTFNGESTEHAELVEMNHVLQERNDLLVKKSDGLEAALTAERLLRRDATRTLQCTKCRDMDEMLERLKQEHRSTISTYSKTNATLQATLTDVNHELCTLRTSLDTSREAEVAARREVAEMRSREGAVKRELEAFQRETEARELEQSDLLAQLQQRVAELESRNRERHMSAAKVRRESSAAVTPSAEVPMTTPVTKRSASPPSVDRVQLLSAAEELKRAMRDAEKRLQDRDRCASASGSSVSSGGNLHASQSSHSDLADLPHCAVPLSLGALSVSRRHSSHASGTPGSESQHHRTSTPPHIPLSPGLPLPGATAKSRASPSKSVGFRTDSPADSARRMGYFRQTTADAYQPRMADPPPATHPYET